MMRWLHKVTIVALLAGCAWACGSSAGARLVLQFNGFFDPQNGQPDVVGPTFVEADIVQDLCPDLSVEPFGETIVGARFTNQEKANILLDTVTVDVPESGVGVVTRGVSFNLPGGRCSDDATRACAVNADCVLGLCRHAETPVTFVLYDLITKALVDPGVYDTVVTFSGQDDANRRYTIETRITTTFANFDSCG